MNEQKLVGKQFFKHILNNILILSSILLFFGITMFLLVQNITYNSVDMELYETSELVEKLKDNIKIKEQLPNLGVNIKSFELNSIIDNPKIIFIIRDKNGNVLNSEYFGSGYEEYISEVQFSENKLDKVYQLTIDNEFYYRAINTKISEKGEDDLFIQLLINVDTERYLVSNYFDIIIHAVILGIAIVIIASVLMARRTMVPIMNMLKKQNEFVSNVSHELRTPLTIIQAKQELLLQEPNAKIVDKIEDISLTLNETKRLGKLIKDLLMLSRADNKQLKLQKEEIDIDEFISNFVKPYQEIVEMEEKKLVLNLNYKKVAMIDTNKIYQVMVILLDNAMKYTEKGDTIEIATSQKDNKCVIEVKDTGIGISDESVNRIFERFYREDKARNRETGGTGLGLSIADMIINAHSGTIRASHNGNDGTIFTIKLPR